MIKILFVCHGNICRSPLAHLYFQDFIEKQHLSHSFFIDSAATSYEEIGNPVHPGTKRKLAEAGISCAGKRARHMEKSDYQEFDYLIGMDQQNIRNMLRITSGDPEKKLYKMMDFAINWEYPKAEGKSSPDVADPWYTGDFEATWRDITEGCAGLFKFLKKKYHL